MRMRCGGMGADIDGQDGEDVQDGMRLGGRK